MNYNSFINININNLNHNINFIKNTYKYKYYILDVSNNAFYHGMYIVKYLKNKIDCLYVNNLNDCFLIRKYDKDIPIIYSGLVNNDIVLDLVMNNAIILIKNKNTLLDILKLNIKDNISIILNIDLKNYNGINSLDEVLDIIDLVKENKYIEIIGLKAKIIEEEYDNFKYVIMPLKNLKYIILNDESDKKKIILSNTLKLDYSVYGINNISKKYPKKTSKKLLQLFTFNTRVLKIKKFNKNKKEYFIAIIPIGCLNSLLNSINKVWINNKLFKVIKVFEEYSLIEVDNTIRINDIVQIVSFNNPLENYFPNNTLMYFSLLNNFPIAYIE